MIHTDDHCLARLFLHCSRGSDRIAHITADKSVEIGVLAENLQSEVICVINRIHVIFNRDDLHALVLRDGVFRALRPVLMARRTDAPDKDRHLSFISELLAEGLRQVNAVLIVVRVSDISDALATGRRIGARKRDDLLPGVHHLIKDRRNDLFIGDINAYNIVSFFHGLPEPFHLVLRGRRGRRHILIGNAYALVEELPLCILHTERNRVPPGVDGLVCEVESVTVLERSVGIEVVIKIDRRTHGLFEIFRSLFFFFGG